MSKLNLSETHRQHIFSLFIFFILILSFVFVKMQIRLLGYQVLKTANQVQTLTERLVLKKTKYVALFSKIQGGISGKEKQAYNSSHKIIYIIGDNTIIDY
ncbi:MAG: hypothetical protein HAW63_05145 [Bdellovibrionaceae bacterium]|nr:hypothetical protein [Pseudobdellovibrionaceae bacterium]